MSDKLVVEFYDQFLPTPVATVLSLHGGDNPASAALTLCDFLGQIQKLEKPRFEDAGVLAARFIIWHSTHVGGKRGLEVYDAALIHQATDYGYQLARVYATEDRPSVEIVQDRYTTTEEWESAEIYLKALNLSQRIPFASKPSTSTIQSPSSYHQSRRRDPQK